MRTVFLPKYYVVFGQHQVVVTAIDEVGACVKAFRNVWGNSDVYGIPPNFRVSQQGFNTHTDDKYYNTRAIIDLVLLENDFEDVNDILNNEHPPYGGTFDTNTNYNDDDWRQDV